jgi:hypothetical protein
MELEFKLYDYTKMPRKGVFGAGAMSSSQAAQELGTTSSTTAVNAAVPLEEQPMAETTSKIHYAIRTTGDNLPDAAQHPPVPPSLAAMRGISSESDRSKRRSDFSARNAEVGEGGTNGNGNPGPGGSLRSDLLEPRR